MTWEPRNRVEDEDNNNEDDVSGSGRKSADNVKDPGELFQVERNANCCAGEGGAERRMHIQTT